LDVSVTFPLTTIPQAGAMPVPSGCAIIDVGCIDNAPIAANETIVATMYDTIVRFIQKRERKLSIYVKLNFVLKFMMVIIKYNHVLTLLDVT
jgi:hypothetical protein